MMQFFRVIQEQTQTLFPTAAHYDGLPAKWIWHSIDNECVKKGLKNANREFFSANSEKNSPNTGRTTSEQRIFTGLRL